MLLIEVGAALLFWLWLVPRLLRRCGNRLRRHFPQLKMRFLLSPLYRELYWMRPLRDNHAHYTIAMHEAGHLVAGIVLMDRPGQTAPDGAVLVAFGSNSPSGLAFIDYSRKENQCAVAGTVQHMIMLAGGFAAEVALAHRNSETMCKQIWKTWFGAHVDLSNLVISSLAVLHDVKRGVVPADSTEFLGVDPKSANFRTELLEAVHLAALELVQQHYEWVEKIARWLVRHGNITLAEAQGLKP